MMFRILQAEVDLAILLLVSQDDVILITRIPHGWTEC